MHFRLPRNRNKIQSRCNTGLKYIIPLQFLAQQNDMKIIYVWGNPPNILATVVNT